MNKHTHHSTHIHHAPASSGYVGLDIGSRAVKAVHLDAQGRVAHTAHFQRTEPDLSAEAERIARVLAQRGFVPARTVACAPRQAVACAVIELPPRESGAPVDRIARTEVARLNGLNERTIETAIADLPPARRAGGGSDGLVWACPHEAVDAVLSAGARAGLDVRAVDVGARALAELVRKPEDPADQATVVVDLGWMGASVLILLGGVLVFDRPVANTGIVSVIEQGVGMGLDPAAVELALRTGQGLERLEQAARPLVARLDAEIERSLNYVQGRYALESVRRLHLVGGGAALLGRGAPGELALAAHMNAEPVCEMGPELAQAYALARAAAGHGVPFNLVPAPQIRDEAQRRLNKRWASVCAVAGAVSVAATVGARGLAGGASSVEPWQVQELSEQVTQADAEIVRLRGELADEGRRLRRARQVGGHPDWSLMMGILANAAGDAVILRKVELRPVVGGEDRFELKVNGLALSQADVARFALALNDSGVVEDHRLTGTRRATHQGVEGVGFDLTATLGPGAPERSPQ